MRTLSTLAAVIIALTLQAPSSNAGLPDVRSGGKYAADYTEYVHVIIDNNDKTASFMYCATNEVKECKMLGNHAKYKLRDLQLRQKRLKTEGIKMLAADGGVLIAAALAGTITTLTLPTPAGPAVILLYAASGAAGAGVFIIKNYFIPGADTGVKRIKDSSLLEKSLMTGKDVVVNEPITDFAEHLDAVLKTII